MIDLMGGVIFTICFFAAMLFWDLLLKILAVFSLKGARRYEFRKVGGYANVCFALARVYTGMKILRRPECPADLPLPFMIISNHQSFVDIAFLLYAFNDYRLLFVAKDSLARGIPYVSPLFRLQRHALVSRAGNGRKTRAELHRLAKTAPKGYCPVVFPEGTRSRTGDLGRFHSGAVRSILSETPMPVLCVAIDGGHMVSGLSNLFQKMHRTRYTMKALKLYPPPEGKNGIQAILRDARESIDRQLKTWRETGNRGKGEK